MPDSSKPPIQNGWEQWMAWYAQRLLLEAKTQEQKTTHGWCQSCLYHSQLHGTRGHTAGRKEIIVAFSIFELMKNHTNAHLLLMHG